MTLTIDRSYMSLGYRPMLSLHLCEMWVCVNLFHPHRGLWTRLALSACHCYASFVPLGSCECVFLPMKVPVCVCVITHTLVCSDILCAYACLDCVLLHSAKIQLLSVPVHCVQCCVHWPWAFGLSREQCRIDNSQTIAGICCGAMGWGTYLVL